MKTIALSLSVAIGWFVASAADAAEACKAPAACTEVQTCGAADHCGCCGCNCCCEKHCQVVCEMKEVKKTVWVVKCEDFCAPLPNCGHRCRDCCNDCEAAGAEPESCDGCGKGCDPCAVERNKCRIPPKCGKVRTKKTLEKKEIVCMVPSYKCVVVYTCPNCGSSQGCGSQKALPTPAKPGSPAPTPERTTEDAPMPPVIGTSFMK